MPRNCQSRIRACDEFEPARSARINVSDLGAIGIGATVAGQAPPTPPGMRVRNGRFEKLRSGEFWDSQAIPCSLWPAPAQADHQPPSAFVHAVHAAPALLHRSRQQTRLHRAPPTYAPVHLAASRASDAMHSQASCLVTVLLVRFFTVLFQPCSLPRLLQPLLTSRSHYGRPLASPLLRRTATRRDLPR